MSLTRVYAELRPYFGDSVPRRYSLRWSGRLQKRKKRLVGEFDPGKQTIFVAEELQRFPSFVDVVVAHEMAHLAIWLSLKKDWRIGHGKDWKAMLDRLDRRRLLEKIL